MLEKRPSGRGVGSRGGPTILKKARRVLTVLSHSSFLVRFMSHALIVSMPHCMRIWGAHHMHVPLHVIHRIHLRVTLLCMMGFLGIQGIRCWPLLAGVWRAIAPLMKPWCAEGEVPTAANLNLYRGLHSRVGWHCDEPLFGGAGCSKLIVSVSFGSHFFFQVEGQVLSGR